MAVRVAINGFGRIGRLVLRAILETGRNDIEVVAINDLASAQANAHLLKYDSVHGRLLKDIKSDDSALIIEGRRIAALSELSPANLPWDEMDVDVVLECTGLFTDRKKASLHIEAGAKKVLISAPGKDADLTVVYGVNHDKILPEHTIVSNASCTTNCLAPVAKVLNELVGLKEGFVTTVHAYTGDQKTVDSMHSDLRRARAAALSMIPTSTGAARAVGLVLPELAGKLDGTAIRVPTANVSLIDLVFTAGRKTNIQEINEAMMVAAEGSLKGILDVNGEPLVSSDFNHSSASSTFDLTQTQLVGDRLVRVLSWYDNEWGFSNRMVDTAVALGLSL